MEGRYARVGMGIRGARLPGVARDPRDKNEAEKPTQVCSERACTIDRSGDGPVATGVPEEHGEFMPGVLF